MSITQIAFAVSVFTLFAVIFSSVVLNRYTSFEPKPHLGTIVDKYVSHRDTMVAATASITEPLREGWSDHKFVVPVIGGHWQARRSGDGGGRRSKGHHVNAIIEYTVNAGSGVDLTKQCTMTMHDYATEEHAHRGLDRVPIGKQTQIHVSKSHDGKYCASKSKMQSYFIGGVSVLSSLGAIYIIAGGLVIYVYLHDKDDHASVQAAVPRVDIELADVSRQCHDTRMVIASAATEAESDTVAAPGQSPVSAERSGHLFQETGLCEAMENGQKPVVAVVVAQRVSCDSDLECGTSTTVSTWTSTSTGTSTTELSPAGSLRHTVPPRRLAAYLPVAAACFLPQLRAGDSTPTRSPRSPPVATVVPVPVTSGSSVRRDIPWC